MRYKVNVLKTDIKKGVCGDSTKCAVARAMNRDCKTAGGEFYLLGPDGSYNPYGDGARVRFVVPKKVTDFIDAFDDGFKTLKPFSFIIIL